MFIVCIQLAIRAKADGARRENGRGRERWGVDRSWRVEERRLYISFLNSKSSATDQSPTSKAEIQRRVKKDRETRGMQEEE